MSESIWIATAPEKKFPSLRGDIETDVAVVGGGIAGIVAAYLLAREGRRVALLEARRVGGGETGHTTAHLTEQLDAGYSTLAREFDREAALLAARASRRAIDAIASIAAREKIDCSFEVVPGFLYSESESDRDALEKEAEAARVAGVAATFTTEVPLPFRVAAGVRFDRQAEFHPLRFVRALAAAAARDGASIFEETRVTDVDDGEPAVVTTTHGTVRARDVLMLTNVPINQRGILQTKLPAARSYAVAGRPGIQIEHALFWDTADPYHYVRTWTDGADTWVIAGGEDHRTGAEVDTREKWDAIESFAQTKFGVKRVEHRWSGQIIEPPDGLPYIGRLALGEHVWIGTGYSGQGMTFGTFSALMLADLVLGRASEWADLFAPARVPPLASLPEYLRDNVEYPKRLALDRLTRHDVEREGLDAIEPGEGRIVEIEDEKLAASRSPSGELRLLSAVCTHMGCDVRWNRAERSWDCPCHGSRFAPDGSVLNGPASKGLKKIDLVGE